MKFHSNMFGWEYVWRDFADSKGGKVVSDDTKDGDPISAMHLPVEGTSAWVTITPVRGKTNKASGTIASMHYSPAENFAFRIRTEKGVDQLGKVLGMQDIQLGDAEFDKSYLIQGTDEGKVRNLFSDMKLRDLILQNKVSELRLVANSEGLPSEHLVPNGRHAVVYSFDQTLEKFDQLESLYAILTSVVHRIGSIPALAGDDVECSEPVEEVHSKKLHSPLLDMA